jgi:hypothetical protein
MTMLDPSRQILQDVCTALEDNSPEHDWWLDPRTGEVELRSEDFDVDESDHPEERGLLLVEPIGSHDAYADLDDFAERVRDPRARDLLTRAIEGRGAFRRFKDTLLEFPDLRAAWFAFHDARMERRAIEWLAAHDLIDAERADAMLADRPDPDLPQLGGAFDPHEVARAVARDLRDLYGERLKHVVLFGSWARGDAHPESDIDLLVVLDEVDDRIAERRRIGEITWRHSLDNDTVVVALPAAEDDYARSGMPLMARVRDEGVPVT